TWIIIFGIHLRSAASRFWTTKVLLGLTGFVGLMAPLHTSLREFLRNRILSFSGQVDPMQWGYDTELIHLGSTMIALTAIVLLILTIWAWLMPTNLIPRDGSRPSNAF
ncbi:hypothetical protein, partial [Haloferula sp.]|uniref:hypothetical protein n=1 Tax=Haloferula sp. TaxID=2497595 RepID=UPI003C708201